MNQYDNYKPTDINWIGEIPSHWEEKKLKYEVTLNDEVLAETTEEDYTIEYVEISSVNGQNGIVEKATYTFRDAPSRARRKVKHGDVIVSTVRTYLRAIAKIENPPANMIVSTGFAVIRPKGIQTDFAGYLFNTEFFVNEVISRSVGVSYPAINATDLINIKVPLPSLIEQAAIAAYLDDKTAKIDMLIDRKRRLIDLLRKEKSALINEAVTKGINPDVPMKPSGIEWLGEIPIHWEAVPLTKYLKSIIDYRGRTPIKQEEGVFLVTARNIKGGFINYSLSEEYVSKEEWIKFMQRGELEVGDVLFTTEAPLGEVANVDRTDICLAQRIIKFRGNQLYVNNYFLKYWILSNSFQNDLQSLATGSTAQGIKASKLNSLIMVLPPLDEQADIVQFLISGSAKIDFAISRIEREIELMQEYRTALISEVVTGKVRVV